MIEIFKTNVKSKKQAKEIIPLLKRQYRNAEINFDLQDCDKILRVEGETICVNTVVKILLQLNFNCEVLP